MLKAPGRESMSEGSITSSAAPIGAVTSHYDSRTTPSKPIVRRSWHWASTAPQRVASRPSTTTGSHLSGAGVAIAITQISSSDVDS